MEINSNILESGQWVDVSHIRGMSFFRVYTPLYGSRSNLPRLCECKRRLGEQTFGQRPHVRQFSVARLLKFCRTRRGCFCGGGCLILCIKCRLRKLMLRCPQKRFLQPEQSRRCLRRSSWARRLGVRLCPLHRTAQSATSEPHYRSRPLRAS